MKTFLFMLVMLTGAVIIAQAQQTTQAKKDTTVTELIGRYTFPDGSVVEQVEVTFDSTGLNMVSDAGTSVLQKLGVDSFALVSFQGTAVFKRDENKKVKTVIIDAVGYHLEGKKEDTAAATRPVALLPDMHKQYALAPLTR
ncbi:MAG: hypothetical protein GTN67_12710 [Hydrotalea flava]|uniref:hypothetical protein n=1 Tax=Hydrotalea TaxID=1004300 RepID=UPI0016A7A753|nr:MULTISPECIES: hypothetical protein [Hydrotalea]MBY0347495.1 hypothetical protein [Hydrotalea flava]NIM36183.1 hypothetical protein [Hydrotalea flava]NIM39034.1 hypothetical protein [Hydrotalea flava]NIN04269.1 hypothetical protein [Hydrotalea flava]NIN15895.1 hypothetical protein [Hydrotalea flava]